MGGETGLRFGGRGLIGSGVQRRDSCMMGDVRNVCPQRMERRRAGVGRYLSRCLANRDRVQEEHRTNRWSICL